MIAGGCGGVPHMFSSGWGGECLQPCLSRTNCWNSSKRSASPLELAMKQIDTLLDAMDGRPDSLKAALRGGRRASTCLG